jgi:hypothetical protein
LRAISLFITNTVPFRAFPVALYDYIKPEQKLHVFFQINKRLQLLQAFIGFTVLTPKSQHPNSQRPPQTRKHVLQGSKANTGQSREAGRYRFTFGQRAVSERLPAASGVPTGSLAEKPRGFGTPAAGSREQARAAVKRQRPASRRVQSNIPAYPAPPLDGLQSSIPIKVITW